MRLRLPLKSEVLSFVQNVDKELKNSGKAGATSGRGSSGYGGGKGWFRGNALAPQDKRKLIAKSWSIQMLENKAQHEAFFDPPSGINPTS